MSRENELDECKLPEVKEGRGRKMKSTVGYFYVLAQVGVILSPAQTNDPRHDHRNRHSNEPITAQDQRRHTQVSESDGNHNTRPKMPKALSSTIQ